MENRKVIITGANSGIGKAAAKKFASEGWHVVMACRNQEKGTMAKNEIVELSGSYNVDFMQLDVSSFNSVRKFCNEYLSGNNHLDVLIHNAAYFNHGEKQYQMSADGFEITFATNTFGPFLMTELLKDLLAKSDDPRILNACTTNIKHFFDPMREIELDNLQGEYKESRPYSVYKLYGDSKMALLMLTFKWAEELESDGINVHAVMINNIRQEWQSLKKFRSWYRIVAILQNLIAYSPRIMADIYYQISTSDAFGKVSGKLINHRLEIVQRSSLKEDSAWLQVIREIRNGSTYPVYAENREVWEKVWKICKEVTGSNFAKSTLNS